MGHACAPFRQSHSLLPRRTSSRLNVFNQYKQGEQTKERCVLRKLSIDWSEVKKEDRIMSQKIYETKVNNGRIELTNLPFENNQEVKVIVLPKFKLDLNALEEAQRLTSSIKGNLSDEISAERDER
jgi:hypothetical protein